MPLLGDVLACEPADVLAHRGTELVGLEHHERCGLDVVVQLGLELAVRPGEICGFLGYAVALKTGNPAAVNSTFLLFFPFLFLTSSYVPRDQLSGWLDTVAAWNPVTYLLEGLRSLTMEGWVWSSVAQALLAIGVVGALSMSLCFAALRGRLRRG